MRLVRALLFALVLLVPCSAFADAPADVQVFNKQYLFKGAWMPDEDPALIGPENFKTLKNLRYTDSSIEGVLGYTKVNTTPLGYTDIQNGYQLYVNASGQTSHILVQSKNAAGTASNVYLNTAAVPDQGDFSSTVLHSDSSSAGVGRFADGPGGVVLYSNGAENRIWGGNETRAAGFYTCSDSSESDPKDYTEAVQNNLSGSGEYAVVGDHKYWIVLSTRALSGVYYTVSTPNTTASEVSAKYWNGTDFEAVGGFSDGTSNGSVTLNKNGWMTFDSTVGSAKPHHFEGAYLYAYQFNASAGAANISHVAVNAPWQPIVDVWDGTYRTNTQFQVYRSGKSESYTLETQDESSVQYPVAGLVGNCTADDYAVVMFSDRTAAIKYKFIAGATNENDSNATVYYWSGSDWAEVGGFVDGTDNGTATMSRDGMMTWLSPGKGVEFKRTLLGVTGYAYKIAWDAGLGTEKDGDGTSVAIDTVYGVPASLPPSVGKFFAMFRGRAMLCNFEDTGEPNRIDYTLVNTPDVWNGELSSNGGAQSLYIGDNRPLVAGAEIYNRIGNSVSSLFIALKATQTFVIQGSGPEDFTVHTVSKSVGCAAPLTLATCEMGYDMAEGVQRNVAIWLSYAGPMMYDGMVLQPINGIDSYFNPAEDNCINYEALDKARAWYDSTYREYNLLVPSGEGQATVNTWLVYDLGRKKWFVKDTGTATIPQCGWGVQDTDGARYAYAGRNDGIVMRLEDGTSWDGVPISQVVETGDFLLDDDAWHLTRIRFLKVIASRIEEAHTLSISHIPDTVDDGLNFSFTDTDGFVWTDWAGFTWNSGSLLTLSLNLTSSSATTVKATTPTNLFGGFHRFRFSVNTDDTKHGFRPVGFALQGYVERDDK